MSRNVRPCPYVGDNYASCGKVMIIGDSHYTKSELTDKGIKKFTIGMIKKVSSAENTGYFKRIHEFMKYLDWGYAKCGIEDFFDNIIFYNYFDYFVCCRRKDPRKINNNSRDSAKTFVELVKKHEPKIIICFSKRAYSCMPGEKRLKEIQMDCEEKTLSYDSLKNIQSSEERKQKKSRGSFCTYTIENGSKQEIQVFGLLHLTGAWGNSGPAAYDGEDTLEILKENLQMVEENQ